MLIQLSAEHYLDCFELPDHPNAFVLGSFARHVTLYSQQVRALNLIHSLVKTRRLTPGSSVLVVGGGAAGITAATSVLLSVGGTQVVLLEKSGHVMPLQLNSAKRFVHPHIYDWPEAGSTSANAGLPDVYNWKAGYARAVAATLGGKWKKIETQYPKRLEFRSQAQLSGIQPTTNGYKVSWKDEHGPQERCFDFLVLAMGFGTDTDNLNQGEDYWRDSWIDQLRGESSSWLVSGTGDGGLTDLMRLKVKEFQHHNIIKAFSSGGGHSLKDVRRVIEGERPENHLNALSSEFGGALQQVLESFDIQQKIEVTLNDEKDLADARASLLNRFIVHELQQAGAFTFRKGRLSMPTKVGTRFQVVEITGKTFDRVLIRRGPNRDVPSKQIAELEVEEAFKNAFDRLSSRWNDWTRIHLPQEDPTRIPCWTTDELNAEGGFKLPPTNISRVPPANACLVIAGDRTPLGLSKESDFERTIRQALSEAEGVMITGELHILRASDAFTVRDHHRSMVELLCKVPVAVFDVTDLEPAVMILLGIRAVVRRGVSVTVTRNPGGSDLWATLPFNLREVNTISLAHPPGTKSTDRQSPINRLSSAIKDAATEFQRESHYSDLPGYFEVRMPSSEGVVDEDRVLILCPFHPDYLTATYQGFLGPELNAMFKPKVVQLISELTSPKLVALRLYDAIRRAFFCIADWTTWRPNVMFEFGVRCAASDQITLCLLNRTAPVPENLTGLGTQLQRLRQFFSPVEYDPAGGGGQFDAVKRLLNSYAGTATQNDVSLFNLRHEGETFGRAAEFLHTEIDPALRPVEALLGAAAKGLAEHADQLPGVLFGSDPRIGQLARNAATDRLLAAWYFVKHRRLGLQAAHGSAMELLYDLGNDLLARLPDDDPARAEIQFEVDRQKGVRV